MEWNKITPFSPAELKKRMQAQPLEPGVEYSWLPAVPKKVRVRGASAPANQMRFDFSEDAAPSDSGKA
ncbi:MAG: hypothetical protein O2876_06370 [Proteobacteria bacterium]|nr:hypothetical protein [Pseudomonadota bacterium]